MTESSLIEIGQKIGSVAESNGLFTFGLAQRIGERDILEMTVGELISFIREYSTWFNETYGAV